MNMCVFNSLAKPDAQLDIGFHQLFGSETYNRWVRLADSTACCSECQKVDGLTTGGGWAEGWVPFALRKCGHPDRENQQCILERTRVVQLQPTLALFGHMTDLSWVEID